MADQAASTYATTSSNAAATSPNKVAVIPDAEGYLRQVVVLGYGDGSDNIIDGSPAHPLNVDVTNFPTTQAVNGSVSVSNLPATQPVSGTVAVSNLPATQPISAASLPLPSNAAEETGGNLAAAKVDLDVLAGTVSGGKVQVEANLAVESIEIGKVDQGNAGASAWPVTDTTAETYLATIAADIAGLATAVNQTNGNQETKIVQGGNTAAVDSNGRVAVLARALDGSDSSGDALSNSNTSVQANNGSPVQFKTLPYIYNGTSWDRQRSANAAANTSGTGLLGAGMLLYDGTNWQSAKSLGSGSGVQAVGLNDGTNTANVVAPGTANSTGNALLSAMTTQSVSFSSSITTGTANLASTDAGNYNIVAVQVTGLGSGAASLAFQGSNDNTNWYSVPVNRNSVTLSTPFTSTTAADMYTGALPFRYFRLQLSGQTGGTTSGVVTFKTGNYSPMTIAGQISINGTQAISGNVGSAYATGSAVPANAFYIAGSGLSSGNLSGVTVGSTANDTVASSNGLVSASEPYVYNGSSFDRQRSANAASGTTGTGLLGVGNLGYDGTNWQSIGAVGGDSGLNGLAVAGAAKTYTFTTSSTGAQVLLANTNAEGFSSARLTITSVGTGLGLQPQFASASGGTYVSLSTSLIYNTQNDSAILTQGYTVNNSYVLPIVNNFIQINVSALTGGTLTGVLTLTNEQLPAGLVSTSTVYGAGQNVGNGTLIGYNNSGGQFNLLKDVQSVADGVSGGPLPQGLYGYNGTTWDRARSATTASNTTGTGLLGTGPLSVARTALPSAATNGNYMQNYADKFGRQVVIPQTTRDLVGVATVTVTSSTTAATLIAAAGAGVFTDITDITLVNISATATEVQISDGTNTYEFYAPAGDMRGISLQVPHPATTANTAWTITTVTSIASLKATVKYIKNQ